MAGMPETMRQASTPRRRRPSTPAGRRGVVRSQHHVLGAEQVDAGPAVPLEGQRQHAALGQHGQQPRRRLADAGAAQRQVEHGTFHCRSRPRARLGGGVQVGPRMITRAADGGTVRGRP